MSSLIRDEYIAKLISEGLSPEEAEDVVQKLDPTELEDTKEILLEARDISNEAAKRFLAGKKYSNKNTKVEVGEDGTTMYLHGNAIAHYHHDDPDHVNMTLAGWGTPTTRERLNTLSNHIGIGRPFHQSKHSQYHTTSGGSKEIHSKDIITVHRKTGEVHHFPNWSQGSMKQHVTQYRHKKPEFDPTKAVSKDMFEEKQVPFNDLLMNFDKQYRYILSEGLVPSVRAVFKTIKSVDHKEMIMEELRIILENDKYTFEEKNIQMRAILRNPWNLLQSKEK